MNQWIFLVDGYGMKSEGTGEGSRHVAQFLANTGKKLALEEGLP
jgi:hypothetical protein